ncbi:MAG: hypothetical protein RLZZ417_1700 [Bacteroidota bacterium]|jgi:hypothetical protein
MEMFQMLMSQLQNGGITEIAEKLGVSTTQAEKAVNGALPSLMTELANKSKSAKDNNDDNSFLSLLDKNNDGSVADDILALVAKGGPNSGDVSGLVSNILGGKSDKVVNELSKTSGINPAQAGGLLSMIAPLIMKTLSKTKAEGGLDLAGISSLLDIQKDKAKENAKASGLDGILSMLDANKDGSVVDDAMGLLGKFMK